MGNLTIELGDEREPTLCDCCGNKTHTVHGFVYDGGSAHAVYFATWTEGHPESGIGMAISVGEWGENAASSLRKSVGLLCMPSGNSVQFMAQDPEQSPWGSSEFLGPMLQRQEALESPIIDDIFHIADHVVYDDPRIAKLLSAA